MSQENISDAVPRKGESDLTFGLELEFIFATVDADKPDPHPKDPREVDGKEFPDKEAINRDILVLLTTAGIPAVVTSNDMTDEESITCWILKEDTSVGDDTIRPAENKTIVYTYEPQTELIFSSDRASRDWCPPFSKGCFGMANPDLTRVEVPEKVLGYTDNNSLIRDFGKPSMAGRLAFNLEGLKTPYQDGIRTVEFRYHHDSLDPGAILNWIHVCIKFVEKAYFAKHDELLAQLRQDIAKPTGFGEGDLTQAYYYCASMVTDKDALEQRIEHDAACREKSLKWARACLINLAKDPEEYKAKVLARLGMNSSEKSELTTSNNESTDENEADQDEGNDGSGDSREAPSSSNEDKS
ncbi:hypothetical protein BPAE_0045g00630 [Botrytis paeoniae]|uniref:Uncharacterized protein n=1 Tax=Botrytis paeoniae TaxID=278948 RepID=A0A4Z1FR47_9HELO|nr:hypothetical protein BPAE_0045g00630 [Botrytis paeoniae]